MMTAGKDYGVRVIMAYEHRTIGQVFFPPGVLRDALVRRGLVERIAEPAQPEQSVTDDAQSEADARLFARQRRHLGRK